MVRVPLPQVSEQAGGSNGFVAPGVVAQGNATGAQLERLGEAVARTGFSTAGLAAEQEERLHVAAVKEAQALAEEKILASDRQYRNTLGKAATGKGREQAWQDLKRDLTGIENGLESETERRLFRQVAERRLLDVRASWNTHEDRQIRAYELGAGEAVLQAKAEAARQQLVDRAQEPPERPQEPRKKTQAKAPSNIGEGIVAAYQAAAAQHGGAPTAAPPTKAQDPLLPVRAEAESLAAKKGMSPEEAKLYVRDQLTQVHAGVVADLVEAGRTTEARTYFGRVRKEIDPDSALELEGLVHRASVGEDGAQLAIRIRDQLQAQHRQVLRDPDRTETMPFALPSGDLFTRGHEQIQALYEAGKITLEVRDAARGELDQMSKDRRVQEVELEDRTAKQGEQWLIDNPLASVQQMPAALYQAGRQQGLLDDWNGFADSGRRYSTDRDLFTSLFGASPLFALPPNEFVSLMRRRLAPEQFRTAMGLYASANKIEDLKLTETIPADLFKEALRKSGLLTRDRREEQQGRSEEVFNFHEDVIRRVNDLERRAKRSATRDELKAVLTEASEDKAYSDHGPNVFEPIGAMTQEHVTGMEEEERLALRPGQRVGKSGAYLTAEQLTRFWKTTPPFGAYPVPAALRNADDVYLGEIDQDVRRFFVRQLRDRGFPVNESAVISAWILSGRPEPKDLPQ